MKVFFWGKSVAERQIRRNESLLEQREAAKTRRAAFRADPACDYRTEEDIMTLRPKLR